LFKIDLGIYLLSVKANYEIETSFDHAWVSWSKSTYLNCQALSPSVWASESYLVDTSLSQLLSNSSRISRALEAYRNRALFPHWKTNPLLQVPQVIAAIDCALREARSSFYISRDDILIVDTRSRQTHEFYRGEASKQARLQDSIYFLLPVLKYAAPLLGSTLVHSSGVLAHGHKTAVFLAQSGGGKTTVTKLAQRAGYKVLGDDQVMISRRNGAYIAISVPLNKITDGPNWGLVGALVMLKQGPSFSLAPAVPMDALSRVWADNFGQWSNLSSESRKLLFALYSDLFSDVPVYEMTFEKDFVDWAAIERVLLTD